MSDQANEGDFRWFNGDRAAPSTDHTFWIPGQPSGDGDCCIANFNWTLPYVYDKPCSYTYPGICEKTI